MSEPDLSPELRAALWRATTPGFTRWLAMLRSTGGCSQPIRLTGETTVVRPDTGEVMHHFSTSDEPPGYLLVACGNRRASRCRACAELYRRDTFHLVRSGLVGGKSVPESVRTHPRVFATLTAPSFGTVHTRPERDGQPTPCRPRRSPTTCRHGVSDRCSVHHLIDDCLLGQPICGRCYDYEGAVLWNAHAGDLWRRFTIYLRRELARQAGLPRRSFDGAARVSYAKVAEYQARGLVHFHAVIRLDGASGPAELPPAWATLDLLDASIRAAVATGRLAVPAAGLVLRWGEQTDVRPVVAFDSGTAITEQAVAGYVAKYATKGAETAGTVDRPIRSGASIDRLDVTEHARNMIRTCWALADRPELADLRLRAWSHMLGYRGHFSTKSRRYSTTLTALRDARTEHRRQQGGEPADQASEGADQYSRWTYRGQGLSAAEAHFLPNVSGRP